MRLKNKGEWVKLPKPILIKDLGMKFPTEKDKRKRRYGIYLCHCGSEFESRQDQIKEVSNCGCFRTRIRNEVKIGEKFGRLTVVKDLGTRKSASSEYRYRFVQVICECNSEIKFEANYSSLKQGLTQSCGCLHKERASESCRKVGKGNVKHGMEGTRMYGVWNGMRQRCNNPNHKHYKYYGGKGIKICEEWNDFSVFHEWSMENGYKEGLSIDRLDSEGDYEPSNCEWVTLSENVRRMHEKRASKNE